MLRVTLKGVRGHLVRYILTALAVVLGIGFLSGTFILTDSIQKTFDDLVTETAQNVDVVVRGTEAGAGVDDFTGVQRAQLPLSMADRLEQVDGVRHAAPDIVGTVILVGENGLPVRNGGAPTLGYNYDPDADVGEIKEGRGPLNGSEVLVESATLKRSGHEVGARTKALIGDRPADVTIVGEFELESSAAGASVVLIDQATAEQVFAPEGTVSSFSVYAQDGVGQAELTERISRTLPAKAEAVTGEAFAQETKDLINEGLSFFNIFLGVFAVIALFVGWFIIFNTFTMLVGQRTRELALLRTLGASKTQIRRVVVGEALAVGFIGGVLGLLLGLGLAAGLKALFGLLGLEITGALPVAPSTVVVSMVVAMGATASAAVIPAYRAARIPPIAALRDDYVAPVRSLRIRGGIGIGVTVVGIIAVVLALLADEVPWPLIGFGAALVVIGVLIAAPLLTRPVVRLVAWPFVVTRGTVGRLARENALRNPRRTATTASALMIGLALISSFTVLAASTKASVSDLIENELTGDFVITAGQTGFGDGVGQAIAAMPEVSSVAQVGALQVEVEGDPLSAVAVTAQGIRDNVDVTMASGDLGALDDGQVLINRSTAEDKGWTVGQTITATMGTVTNQPYRIGGVFEDNQVLGTSVLVPRAAYERAVPSASRMDWMVFVSAKDGTDPESLRPALENTVKPYLVLSVEDADEFVDSQAQSINQLLYLLYGLLALSVIIAFFGIVNTLALSVFERTREIGLLRAVGLSRRQLRRMIGIESVATSVFGAVLGCAVGLGLGIALQRGLVSEGLEALSVPVGSLIVFVILAGLAGLVAAAFPAWRAVKLDVLRAISSE